MIDSRPLHEFVATDPSADPDPALAPLLTNIAARLRPACAHLGAGEFDRLVLGIARTKRRWADQERGNTARSRPDC